MQLETFDSTKDKFKEIHKHKQMKNHVIINSRKKREAMWDRKSNNIVLYALQI